MTSIQLREGKQVDFNSASVDWTFHSSAFCDHSHWDWTTEKAEENPCNVSLEISIAPKGQLLQRDDLHYTGGSDS